jgi:hypothetical protein
MGSVLSEVEVEAEINRLAALPETLYECERAAAIEKLQIRAAVLDRRVRAARPKNDGALQGQAILLVDRAAAEAPVNGPELLDSIRDAIKKYIILDPTDADAVALWVTASYSFGEFFIFPRLRIRSATKQCGKSTLLDVIECLVNKPLNLSNVTAPTLMRLISAERPTMLLDEADRYMRNDEDLTSIVNAGHKRNGMVTRCVGDENEVRVFAVYAPMVIAAIRELPGTVEDRSITITMRRKTKDQTVQRFRADRPPAEFGTLASQAKRWAVDHAVALGNADPDMPSALGNRPADNWRPLLAVADAVGADWGKRAREVAANRIDDDEELRVRLLRDIRAVFVEPVLHSDELVHRLVALEDAPWSELQKGKPLTQHRLADLLHDFRIKPTQTKIDGRNRNGFHLEWFEPVFAAYLQAGGETTSTSSTAFETQENIASGALPQSSTWAAPNFYPMQSVGPPDDSVEFRGRGLQDEKASKNSPVEGVEVPVTPAQSARCAQCGAADGKAALHRGHQFGPGGKWLHRECVRFFIAGRG